MRVALTRTVAALAVLLGLGYAGFQTFAGEARQQPPELSATELEKIAAAVPKEAAKPKSPRKVLIFWRCEGFFHGSGIAGGNKAFALMGEKTGAFSVDCSNDYAVFEPANLAKYDAVMLNNTTYLKFPRPELRQALLDYVRSGKGLIGIHAATDNFYDWPEGAKMIGGLFDGHPWGGGGTWAFRIDAPDHVLNRAFGGKGFKLQDEIYQFKDPYSRDDRRVLLTLDLTDPATGKVTGGVKRADKDFAVAWIKTEGKGRVFYCALGHAANVFMDPAVMQFCLDGIQYALGDLQADASPR
ncbi:MAG: ThuA domain-containing protein [Thermoguttaceae bacterium]|jgi:type 1 glutamine amidotransferase